MGVYIKGMEMPVTCCHCQLMSYDPDIEWVDGGRETQGAYICVITHELIDNTKREEHCPLVPVPPHRDLIDRAALRESFRESIEACHKWADEMRKAENEEMVIRAEQSLGTFVECSLRAKNAPTVIPADEPTIGEIVERTLKAKRLMTDNEEGE